jgi:GNAT superfamily N-acetyltransferase
LRVRKAQTRDVAAICRICREAWRDAYAGIFAPEEIERVTAEYYDEERVRAEVERPRGWDGWWVAEDDAGAVVAAGGGGRTGPETGEIFVLYADPNRRYEGSGTALLEAITAEQRQHGAREQWVAVVEGNRKGIPFYESRGFVRRGSREAPAPLSRPSALYWRRLG